MSERYDRHQMIPGWSQNRLAAATVVVMGIGALGNEVVRILAMSGVGRFILCDPDRVEESNLSRTVLFRQADIGRLKVEAAAEALTALAPGVAIQPRPWPLVQGVGLADLRDAALVLGCLDSRAARLQLAGRCQLVRAAYIDGGTHPWGGEVRPYVDPEGPCYGCSLSPEERAVADVPWSCLDVPLASPTGAAAPSSALVGAWMGMLAIRFLMGLGCLPGMLRIDGSRGTTVSVQQQRDPACPLHMSLGPVRKPGVSAQHTVRALRSILPVGGTPLLWEPVQQRVECPQCAFSEVRWGIPVMTPCPRCQIPPRPHTTLELATAPDDMPLAALGVPSCEILAVHTDEGWQWVELQA